jgi:hypothetical protein
MEVSEYAKYRGVALNAVQYAIKAGRIHVDSQNQIDSDIADSEWELNTDSNQARPGRKPKKEPVPRPTELQRGMSFADARALNEVLDAQRREVELKARLGELVGKAEVQAETYKQFRILRDAAMNLPDRLASRIAVLTDRDQVYQVLEQAIREVFLGFSEGKQ